MKFFSLFLIAIITCVVIVPSYGMNTYGTNKIFENSDKHTEVSKKFEEKHNKLMELTKNLEISMTAKNPNDILFCSKQMYNVIFFLIQMSKSKEIDCSLEDFIQMRKQEVSIKALGGKNVYSFGSAIALLHNASDTNQTYDQFLADLYLNSEKRLKEFDEMDQKIKAAKVQDLFIKDEQSQQKELEVLLQGAECKQQGAAHTQNEKDQKKKEKAHNNTLRKRNKQKEKAKQKSQKKKEQQQKEESLRKALEEEVAKEKAQKISLRRKEEAALKQKEKEKKDRERKLKEEEAAQEALRLQQEARKQEEEVAKQKAREEKQKKEQEKQIQLQLVRQKEEEQRKLQEAALKQKEQEIRKKKLKLKEQLKMEQQKQEAQRLADQKEREEKRKLEQKKVQLQLEKEHEEQQKQELAKEEERLKQKQIDLDPKGKARLLVQEQAKQHIKEQQCIAQKAHEIELLKNKNAQLVSLINQMKKRSITKLLMRQQKRSLKEAFKKWQRTAKLFDNKDNKEKKEKCEDNAKALYARNLQRFEFMISHQTPYDNMLRVHIADSIKKYGPNNAIANKLNKNEIMGLSSEKWANDHLDEQIVSYENKIMLLKKENPKLHELYSNQKQLTILIPCETCREKGYLNFRSDC